MEQKNILELLKEIQIIAKMAESDAEKTMKGNKTAKVRLRKEMQKIKTYCQEVRDVVQEKDDETN